MPRKKQRPTSVNKLIQTTTPCAPNNKSDNRVDKKSKSWKCMHRKEGEQLNQLIRDLSVYTSHCRKNDDVCKIRALKAKGAAVSKLERTRLRPRAPSTWLSKPSTWLMTDDFERVLRQYEHAYPNFLFLGASPIDFAAPLGNSCVWPEMCKFTLAKAKESGKSKIALIFNEDYHYQKGSHWICSFLDIPKRVFYFIDSVGNPMPEEVKAFATRLSSESECMYGQKINIVASTMPHQRGNNQCGMYCLFFIISLLTETATYSQLMAERIPDSAMHELRRFLFRHQSKSLSVSKSTRHNSVTKRNYNRTSKKKSEKTKNNRSRKATRRK